MTATEFPNPEMQTLLDGQEVRMAWRGGYWRMNADVGFELALPIRFTVADGARCTPAYSLLLHW